MLSSYEVGYLDPYAATSKLLGSLASKSTTMLSRVALVSSMPCIIYDNKKWSE